MKIKLLTLVMLCMGVTSTHATATDIAKMDNVLYIAPFSSASGEEVVLSLRMKNSNFAATGYQVDIGLPEGMEFVMDGDFYDANLSLERTTATKTNYFTCRESVDNPGKLRILCGSSKKAAFSGTDGEVATIKVKISDTMASGTYEINLLNMELSEGTGFDGIKVSQPIVCEFTISNEQCAAPVIAIENGRLSLSCETEEVTYDVTSSTNIDGTWNTADNNKPLSITVTAKAKRQGYSDSTTTSRTFNLSELNGLKGDMDGDNNLTVQDVTILVNNILKKN